MDPTQLLFSLVVASAIGLLEAAWTFPPLKAGPYRVSWGVLAIFAILLVVTWPFLWWIPALAVLEETIHLYLSGGRMTMDRITHHWSARYLRVNLYPYITFPVITLVGEVLYRLIAL